ncbi:XdhC family protein [Streptomyces sp. NBC_00859]|uniref:XdhC family protein n=1 Tax=Streptomyces sp. NBC_00859 TaxID=2903682 RepID=UPI0038686C2C|nr:XdhC family protein [Streptomyces sp. NBC_00859]
MRELADTAQRWITEGRSAVLARPITEQGFGPRRPADAVLIDSDGHCEGTLYQGLFDTHLAAEAAALAPGHTAHVCQVSVHDNEAKQAGLTCGGQAEVLLQPLNSIPAHWWERLDDGGGVALLTRLDDQQTEAASTVVALDQPDAAAPAQAAGQARRLLARHRAGRETHYTDAGLVLIEAFAAIPHLVIVGGGELAELLCAQAHLLGWHADVAHHDEDAQRVLADRRRSACLIVLSHEPDLDIPAMRTALSLGIPYIGALGSRRTQSRRTTDLLEAGFTEDSLRPIHGPIGLDLGARTPAETALAICAEILGALDRRTAGALRDSSGPINT